MWPKMAGDRSDRINGRGKRKGHGPPVGRRPWAAPALRRSRHRPLVVLLHGFPGFWYAWRHQIAALANAGYRVVVPDLPGYNTSVKPPRVRDCRPGCWLKRWPTHPKSQTRQVPSSHTPIFSNAVRPASRLPNKRMPSPSRFSARWTRISSTRPCARASRGTVAPNSTTSFPWAAATAVGDALFDPLGHERRRRIIRPGRGADA